MGDTSARTETVQDSHGSLTSSSSQVGYPTNTLEYLLGIQESPQPRERQKRPHRAESQAARAPIALREKFQLWARQNSGLELNVTSSSQQDLVTRNVRFAEELLSLSEMQQQNITGKDPVRLQREFPPDPLGNEQDHRNYASTTCMGTQEMIRTIETNEHRKALHPSIENTASTRQILPLSLEVKNKPRQRCGLLCCTTFAS